MTFVRCDNLLQQWHQNVSDWAFRHFGINSYQITRGLCMVSLAALLFLGGLIVWLKINAGGTAFLFCPILCAVVSYFRTFKYEQESYLARYSPSTTIRTYRESLEMRVVCFWLMLFCVVSFFSLSICILFSRGLGSQFLFVLSTGLALVCVPFYGYLVTCGIPPRSGKPTLIDRIRRLLESSSVAHLAT